MYRKGSTRTGGAAKGGYGPSYDPIFQVGIMDKPYHDQLAPIIKAKRSVSLRKFTWERPMDHHYTNAEKKL